MPAGESQAVRHVGDDRHDVEIAVRGVDAQDALRGQLVEEQGQAFPGQKVHRDVFEKIAGADFQDNDMIKPPGPALGQGLALFLVDNLDDAAAFVGVAHEGKDRRLAFFLGQR